MLQYNPQNNLNLTFLGKETNFVKTSKLSADFKKLTERKNFIVNGEIVKTVKTTQITDWLKKDFDLGYSHAMAIYTTFKRRK